MRNRNKMSMSVSFDNEMINRIDEYVTNHHIPSFSAFVREAVAYYLDHNQSVTNVSIQDSEQDSTPEPIVQPVDDTPKPDKPVNGDFNWGGLDID